MNLVDLTLQKKIGQLFFIGLPTANFDQEAASLISKISPGGVCLFARNCKDPQDIRSLLDSIRQNSLFEPFLALDQEGGLVDRLRRIVEPFPSAADTSARGSVESVKFLAITTAKILRLLGFNMNFAPVVDVIDSSRIDNNNGALLSRAFGRSPEDVIKLAGAYADTLFEEGIMPCHKHFPGIGGIEVDAHEDLPSVPLDRDALSAKDFVPYKQLLPNPSACAIMTGHVVFPNFDLQESDSGGRLLPTSLSFNIITRLLRHELGFKGLALTDDLEMGAIIRHYGMAEAAKLAVQAGNDFILICNDPEKMYEGYNGVLDAVASGEIEEDRIDESLQRIQAARKMLQKPTDFSRAKLAGLSQEIVRLKEKIK